MCKYFSQNPLCFVYTPCIFPPMHRNTTGTAWPTWRDRARGEGRANCREQRHQQTEPLATWDKPSAAHRRGYGMGRAAESGNRFHDTCWCFRSSGACISGDSLRSGGGFQRFTIQVLTLETKGIPHDRHHSPVADTNHNQLDSCNGDLVCKQDAASRKGINHQSERCRDHGNQKNLPRSFQRIGVHRRALLFDFKAGVSCHIRCASAACRRVADLSVHSVLCCNRSGHRAVRRNMADTETARRHLGGLPFLPSFLRGLIPILQVEQLFPWSRNSASAPIAYSVREHVKLLC